MGSFTDSRLVFQAEWYDQNAELVRRYQFMFYPVDNTVEMFDVKNRRLFLKRSAVPNITEDKLYVGSVVNVNSRQLTLTGYGDNFTEKTLATRNEKTLAIIKPDAVGKVGPILERVCREGIKFCNAKMVNMSKADAASFYAEHSGKHFFDDLIEFIVSGPVIALELMGDDVIARWNKIIGPNNASEARSKVPQSLRALYGSNGTANACHGSENPAAAAREIDFFFGAGRGLSGTARLSGSTLCLVKPHAIENGNIGKIISMITDNGFAISAMEMFNLDRANAEEFLEIYKGVVTEYSQMVTELCSGPCLAIEIVGQHKDFRDFVGPADPEIAKHLRPKTVRAKFGQDKIFNSVHCTDLPEDVGLEVEYFFRILSQ
ncbi:hypothetical protein ACHWQZ_G018245 [Mnemiopsis leidyi]